MSEDVPTGQAGESVRGLVLRVIGPRVVAGTGIVVGSTALTAEHVDAAGDSHPVQVRPPEGQDDASQPAGGDTLVDGSVTTVESVTVSSQATGESVSSSLETTIRPETDGGTGTDSAPTKTTDQGQDGETGSGEETGPDGGAQDSGSGGWPGPQGNEILVEFVQHIVVHDLPNGQFLVESVITIVVHQDGQRQVFEDHQQKVVTKEQADSDLVIQQDGDVVIRLDSDGNVTVDIDGELTVTEQPGDPFDAIPDGAVVVIQDQQLTVVDEHEIEDPDVAGHFDQTANAVDDPDDGEADIFVVDQSQTKT